jgi:hypothetical protein
METPEELAKLIGDIKTNNGLILESEYYGQDPPTNPPEGPEPLEGPVGREEKLISKFEEWLLNSPDMKIEWNNYLNSGNNPEQITPDTVMQFFNEWIHQIPEWLHDYCDHDFEYKNTEEDETGPYDTFKCTKCGETSVRRHR